MHRDALAQEGQASAASAYNVAKLVEFDIETMPLSDALEVFARVTGVSVAADAAHTRRQASAVRGLMSPAQALERMLNGTGLRMRASEPGSAVVYLPARRKSLRDDKPALPLDQLAQHELAGLDSGDPAHLQYAARLQGAIMAGLCASPQTRPGRYRLALQVRVDGQGRVTRHKRLDTTGSETRDQRIDQLVGHVGVGMGPPVGLPQPVLVLVLPSSAIVRSGCPAQKGLG